jgi:hypothetical protein
MREANMSSLFDDVKARAIPYASHESDLYLPDTPEVRALLAAHNRTAQPFINQVEGGQWLDVPFAYIP